MSICRIASIHYAPVKALRIYRGHPYEIKGVALNTPPLLLETHDIVQRDEGPVTTGPGGGKRQVLQYPVLGEEIARCLVAEWTENGLGMTPDSHPGIWVVRDRIPVMKKDPLSGEEVADLDVFGKQVFRSATAEEAVQMWEDDIATARRVDRAYAEWCYVDGNRIAADIRNIQFIPKNYKLAARQYGLEADWLKEGAALEVRPCISCTKVISKRAIVCPHCQQVVDFERYAAMQVQKDQALRDAKKSLQAA